MEAMASRPLTASTSDGILPFSSRGQKKAQLELISHYVPSNRAFPLCRKGFICGDSARAGAVQATKTLETISRALNLVLEKEFRNLLKGHIKEDICWRKSSYTAIGSSSQGLFALKVMGHVRFESTFGLVRIRCQAADDTNKSDPQAKDAARRALEQAFEGKKNAFKKWDQEIRDRELASGDGSGGGTWGGGGDGDDGGRFGPDSWNWEEAGEVFMATMALIILYMCITLGPQDTLKFFIFWIKFVLRGFKIRSMPKKYRLSRDSAVVSASVTDSASDSYMSPHKKRERQGREDEENIEEMEERYERERREGGNSGYREGKEQREDRDIGRFFNERGE